MSSRRGLEHVQLPSAVEKTGLVPCRPRDGDCCTDKKWATKLASGSHSMALPCARARFGQPRERHVWTSDETTDLATDACSQPRARVAWKCGERADAYVLSRHEGRPASRQRPQSIPHLTVEQHAVRARQIFRPVAPWPSEASVACARPMQE